MQGSTATRAGTWLFALSLAILVAGGAAWWSVAASGGSLPWVDPPLPRGIVAAEGTIEGTEIILAAAVPGTLAMVAAEGEKVAEGQVVARIESAALAARVAQAEAGVDAALAAERQARAAAAAVPDGVPEAVQEQAQAALDAAAAQVRLARATLDEARAVAEQREVSAPGSATVLAQLTQPGELVVPGAPLLALADLSALYVQIYVPQRQMVELHLNDPARVYVKDLDNVAQQRYFTGRVSWIAREAEFTPRNAHTEEDRARLVYAVRVAVADPEDLLKLGMPATVRIRYQADATWPDWKE